MSSAVEAPLATSDWALPTRRECPLTRPWNPAALARCWMIFRIPLSLSAVFEITLPLKTRRKSGPEEMPAASRHTSIAAIVALQT